VGKVDRAAVIKEINTGSFDTIIGKVKLENGLNKNIWAVGQWQGADFFGVAPNLEAGRQACHHQAGVVINKLVNQGRAL
jgi:branched-chain amino acid transport system substrate-binding protein